MDEQTQILAALFQLMQQHIAVTAKDKKAVKKSKPWPRPETAEDLIKRQDADKGYQDLMSEIVFLPQTEFDQHVAEHRENQKIRRQPGT